MTDDDSFSALRDRYAALVGRAAALYGLSPLLGRLYGGLYLTPDALTLDELAVAAGAAKSTVSVAMRQLEHYRLVQRDWRKGDRRDFYRARTDFLGVIGDWYRLFVQHELTYIAEGSADARQALAAAPESGDWPSAEERAALIDRLEALDRLAARFRPWVDALLAEEAADQAVPAEIIPIEVG